MNYLYMKGNEGLDAVMSLYKDVEYVRANKILMVEMVKSLEPVDLALEESMGLINRMDVQEILRHLKYLIKVDLNGNTGLIDFVIETLESKFNFSFMLQAIVAYESEDGEEEEEED